MQLGGREGGREGGRLSASTVGGDSGYVTFAANALEEDRFLPLHLAEMCRKREE